MYKDNFVSITMNSIQVNYKPRNTKLYTVSKSDHNFTFKKSINFNNFW